MSEHSGICSTRAGSPKCTCGAVQREMSGPMIRNPDGSLTPAQPLGWQGSGLDFEVRASRWDSEQRRMVPTRPIIWEAYDEDVLVAKGTTRTRIGLAFAIRRAKRRYERDA